MNQFIGKALQHLTGKKDIELVNINELERIVQQYPYFTIAQVLLAKKLKVVQSGGFLPQVQKTVIYFTNPYWLHYQLLEQLPAISFETEDKSNAFNEKETKSFSHSNGLFVTENGSIRFSSEEMMAASDLAKETLQEQKTVDETNEPGKEVDENTCSNTTSNLLETRDTTEEQPSDKIAPSQESEFINKDAAQNQEDKQETYNAVAAIDHPVIPENFQGSDESVTDPTLGVNIEKSTQELEFTAPLEEDDFGQSIDSNFSEEFIQQPDQPKDVHLLDNPLLASTPVPSEEIQKHEPQPAEKDEYILSNLSEKISELNNPAEDIERIDLGDPLASPIDNDIEEDIAGKGEYVLSNLSEKIADLEEPAAEVNHVDLQEPFPSVETTEEQPAPDPFHPESEEVLEELEQEEADKEEKSAEETIKTPATAKGVFIEKSQLQDKDKPYNLPFLQLNKAEPSKLKPSHPDALIPFEPYHTIDYFASQGIKLVLEKDPQDQLGKKLKRFTDWLKHMKKIGPEDATQTVEDNQLETKIQGIANSSNDTAEIVTEAMAEVLIKQGKAEHAIEVYNKLSFLHPDKTPYFADKIQKLKGF